MTFRTHDEERAWRVTHGAVSISSASAAIPVRGINNSRGEANWPSTCSAMAGGGQENPQHHMNLLPIHPPWTEPRLSPDTSASTPGQPSTFWTARMISVQREAQAFQVPGQKKCKLNSGVQLTAVVHIYWQTNVHVTALSTWEEAHLRDFSATTCL